MKQMLVVGLVIGGVVLVAVVVFYVFLMPALIWTRPSAPRTPEWYCFRARAQVRAELRKALDEGRVRAPGRWRGDEVRSMFSFDAPPGGCVLDVEALANGQVLARCLQHPDPADAEVDPAHTVIPIEHYVEGCLASPDGARFLVRATTFYAMHDAKTGRRLWSVKRSPRTLVFGETPAQILCVESHDEQGRNLSGSLIRDALTGAELGRPAVGRPFYELVRNPYRPQWAFLNAHGPSEVVDGSLAGAAVSIPVKAFDGRFTPDGAHLLLRDMQDKLVVVSLPAGTVKQSTSGVRELCPIAPGSPPIVRVQGASAAQAHAVTLESAELVDRGDFPRILDAHPTRPLLLTAGTESVELIEMPSGRKVWSGRMPNAGKTGAFLDGGRRAVTIGNGQAVLWDLTGV